MEEELDLDVSMSLKGEYMLNKKAQTALELLIVLGGILVVAIVVIMILISTGSAKADDITKTDSGHTQLLDKSMFPPTIDNLKCNDRGESLDVEIDVIESISKNIKDYCLVINGEATEYCGELDNGKLALNISKIPESYYSIGVSTRSNLNTISSSSMTLSCSVAGTGVVTGIANFTCPLGYSRVPGLSGYNTKYNKGGFCVMTWEAKADLNSDDIGDGDVNEIACQYTTSTGNQGRYGVWLATKAPSCMPSGTKITSSHDGLVLGNVSFTAAKDLCSNQSQKYTDYDCHLINNNEWMTVARNLEQQPSNWTGNKVGFGSLKTGNAASTSTNALPGINYYVGCGSWVSGLPVVLGVHYGNSGCMISQREESSLAKLMLSTNDVIWDFSGNMLEFVDKTITASTEPIPKVTSGYSQGTYIEFNEIDTILSVGFPGSQYAPSNKFWTSTQGVGKIATRWLSGSNQHILYRGGQYNSASSSGIYSITFNTPYASTYTGFRCVCVPQ